jgi:cell division inhibitor SulA
MRQLSFAIEQPAMSARTSTTPSLGGMVERTQLGHKNNGSLTEVIVSEGGAIQPFQLLPMLAHCNAHQRWLMWLSPNLSMNKHWLKSVGLSDSPVVHLDSNYESQLRLCQRILQAKTSHLIIEWCGDLSSDERAEIRHLAISSGSHVVLTQSL